MTAPLMAAVARLRVRQSGFARKPSYTTPTPPTPLRTFYADAAGGSDSNPGTEGSPFQTITKINSTAIAGDRFYLKGTFTGTTSLCASGSASGTSTNPIQVIVWPGETATLNNGGGVNEWYSVGPVGKSYWWLQDLTINAASGASGSIALQSGSNNWTVVGVTIAAGELKVFNSSDNVFYDCVMSLTTGSIPNNSGDFFNVSNSSHRNFFCRLTQTGTAYHSAGLVGNVQAGATTAEDNHFFDCHFRNPAAGGLQLLGYARNTIVEWCLFTDIGTTPDPTYPPGSKDAVQQASLGVTFRYNTVRDCGFRGFFVASYYYGGYLQNASNGHYHNNTITGCVGNGIYLYAGATVDAPTELINNVFENNIVWANQTGSATEGNGYFGGQWLPVVFNVYNTALPWLSGSIGGNTVRNNLFGRSASDTRFMGIWKNVAYGEGGNADYTKTSFQTAFSGQGAADNIAEGTDPLFVDAGTDDYHLQSGSPGINAGYATAGVTYLDSAPDLGVYEYGGTD